LVLLPLSSQMVLVFKPSRPEERAVEIAAQVNQVLIERDDAAVGIGTRPIERVTRAELGGREQLRALQDHRDARRGEEDRRAECGQLACVPTGGERRCRLEPAYAGRRSGRPPNHACQ